MAREAPIGVIFRRGPSDWVEVVKWNTKTDAFEIGQWFHGRIYERRCDLSPDGSLLIYFASKFKHRKLSDPDNTYTYAWTAVSKPPYLTALALWPKGDCWHGGGSFDSNISIILNHRLHVSKPHPKHLPDRLQVRLKEHVHGEDDPIFSQRLERDGWQLKQEWQVENKGYPSMYVTSQPEVRQKHSPIGSGAVCVTRSISGLDYSERFAFSQRPDADWIEIERASWADWDSGGRLVFAKDGKLYAGTLSASSGLESRELLDLNSETPTSAQAPNGLHIGESCLWSKTTSPEARVTYQRYPPIDFLASQTYP